jgi:tetratricopeptide (TPR) repeat protein
MQITQFRRPFKRPFKRPLSKPWQTGLICLLLLSGTGLTLTLSQRLSGPSPVYAYPFSLDIDDQQTLESEISFYQGRVQQRPADGLDRAALAGAYLKMARVTGADNWYLLAEQAARQSLVNLPYGNDGAVMVLAEIAQAQHKFAEAVRLAEQVSDVKSRSVVVTANLAMGEVEKAAAAADTLVAFTPSLGSLSLRGLTRLSQGDHTGAIADFQQAIAAEEPSEQRASAQVRTFLGRLYAEQGQGETARQLYLEALKIVPNYPPARLQLAQLETRLGHYRTAKRHYAELATVKALEGKALQGIARIHALQSKAAEADWQRAEAALRSQIDQNALGHRRDLAHLLLERGREQDLPEALALLQTETQNRRDADTLDLLAWALLRSGRPLEAQSIIREALGQGIQNAGIFYRAAEIETALDNAAQTKTYLRSVHLLDSTFDQQVRQSLGLISFSQVPVDSSLQDVPL